MALSYTRPNWTNDEGTAINAERLQAISNVLDGLINTDNSKAIVQITFTNADMTVTFADGTIAQFENPNKGEQGPALGARHSKSEKTTTVEIYNTETDEVVDTFYVLDGEDGGGSDIEDVYTTIIAEESDGDITTLTASGKDSITFVAGTDIELYAEPSSKSIRIDLDRERLFEDDEISVLSTWSSDKIDQEVQNAGSWHKYNGIKEVITVSPTAESNTKTITFNDVFEDYAYELFADTFDGSQVVVKSSSYDRTDPELRKGNLEYVVIINTTTQFALRKVGL